jgi:hypothetical protein
LVAKGRTPRHGRRILFNPCWRVTRTGFATSLGLLALASDVRTLPVQARCVLRPFAPVCSHSRPRTKQDKTVYIWTQDSARAPWSKVALEPTNVAPTAGGAPAGAEGKFGDVVWRVSWSVSGNVLAVSSGQSSLFPKLYGRELIAYVVRRRWEGQPLEGEPQGQVRGSVGECLQCELDISDADSPSPGAGIDFVTALIMCVWLIAMSNRPVEARALLLASGRRGDERAGVRLLLSLRQPAVLSLF